jgi:hypothetical protein
LQIRRALLLGPWHSEDFERLLPPNVSIGRGAYYAFKYRLFARAIPSRELPDGFFNGVRNGLGAFMRIEAFVSWLIQVQYFRGAEASNERVFTEWQRLAATQTQAGVGAAIAFGYGFAAYFVSRDRDELYRLLGGLPGNLRAYGLMGAGPPLLYTVSDDVSRFREGFRAFWCIGLCRRTGRCGDDAGRGRTLYRARFLGGLYRPDQPSGEAAAST